MATLQPNGLLRTGHIETGNMMEKCVENVGDYVEKSEEKDVENVLSEVLHKGLGHIQRDSQSDDAESGLSHSDNTPQHVYLMKGHHNLLKEHLQLATAEKGRLEETAAELVEKSEKLKYELAEARAAIRNRDEVMALLEGQLSRLEEKYTRSMEESQKYKLRLGNLEQELKHLKEVCNKYEEEKIHLTEIIRLKEMEKINLDKTISAKDEEQKLQTLIGEKEAEQKQHEMEIHMNYIQIEKNKLSDEVNKLERKNEDLRLKLDAVVANNQLLSEEKAALCAKNSLSIKTLQEHSERWKLLYETCMDKLKLLTSSKKTIDQETQINNETGIDIGNLKHEVREIIQNIEEAKEKDYAIWHSKIQEDVVNAVQLLNAEYSRIESSLLKHNDKLEIITEKLLENSSISPAKQLVFSDTGTAARALKLVEELTQLNVDLKVQYQQLKVQLEHRHEELRKKSELMKPSSELGSGEASKLEENLLKENMLLRDQLTQILNHSPEESRELWKQLKAENTKLQEQLNLLVEHIKELEKVGEKESLTSTPKGIDERIESLCKETISKSKITCTDDLIVATSPEHENNSETKEEEIEDDDDEAEFGQSPDILEELDDMEKQEQSPYYARELFDELKNENMQLQKQLDLLVEQIKEKEDFVDKETITDKDLMTEELYLQNIELKNKLAALENCKSDKELCEQQTLTEPLIWEPPEEYHEILNKIKSENEKLKDRLRMLEEHVNYKASLQNKIVMTDDDIWEEAAKYKEENARLKKHISILQNKIRQQKLEDMGEGEFDPLFEEDEEEDEEREYIVENVLQLRDNQKDRSAVLHENKRLQECLNEQAKVRDKETVENLILDKAELEAQLNALRHELTKLQTNVGNEKHNIQTMTEPDMELVHISMENASLQSQLKQLSRKYETKQGELEKSVLLLRESREASSLLLQETRNVSVHENSVLKKELEDVRQQLRNQEQEIARTRNDTSRENQPPKVAELCNLLDHLRKENTELQLQLKKMLSEKEEKDEVDLNCEGLHLNGTASKDCNLSEKTVVNKNIDSISLLLTVGSHIKSNENVDVARNSQSYCTPTIRVQEQCPAVVINDNRHENGIIQHQQYKFPECRNQIPTNSKRRDKDLLSVGFSKSQHRKYSAPDIGSKDEELESMSMQVSGVHTSTTSLKNQMSYMDSHSSSSDLYSDLKQQRPSMHGLSLDNGNSDLGQEPPNRLSFRPNRDAATNTIPSAQSLELQRELQLEKERCRKYQQNVKKLKSDVQILKNKLSENRKPGKTDSNLAVKQNNTNNNNTLIPALQSPSHFDHNMAEFQRQIAELEQKVREENSMRYSLEVQVNKMRYELQEKLQLEKELTMLQNRLEKDFVSRYELEQLRNSYEVALSRARYEAEMAARDDLNEKLCQINSFIEKQVQEQTRLSQLRNTTETQIKQDFQETRLKLLSELAKVQASLQAKGEEEKELREKCEKLTRECEKKQEIRRKKLIEKSYNVNLTPNSNLKEKEVNSKGYMLDMRSPLHRPTAVQPILNPISSSSVTTATTQVADSWPSEHPFSHILRRELERSIRKHTRTDSLTEHPASSGSAQPTASDEHLEILKKKYFLH
ncbi:hypothetical protein L9F63_021825 [Diploptera punctata]|uniref:Uncharacterized protein n=1 Tax=Diploptera punctata TaxID=6984 RepID=A0AAD7ZNS6_DIPPU|nr:hypothetical protein L9F63_021825 [Diploptera punctata]